ncbi:SGNH/GDSL hydrolase family protein [Cytobacillus gottheilii]|uniref:SGNH/GDSL hydrolase family protein n=1 Tax=Cytobacillus gottheilii TaxID=859144 RepID=UPI002147C1F1|nr:SGNH/GDSL hydrolase family protein [Cytobacillus gottheilii]
MSKQFTFKPSMARNPFMTFRYTFLFFFMLIMLFFLSSCSIGTNTSSGEHVEKSVVYAERKTIDPAFLPQNLAIVSVGDSLTQGVGDSTKKGGYVPYTETLLEEERGIADVVFKNFGVRGNRSDQLLKKLKTDEVKESIAEADLVLVTIGGNDIMKVVRENFTGLNLQAFAQQKTIYEKNLQDVLETINEYNPRAEIGLIGLYNPFLTWFSDIREIDEIMSDWNETSKTILGQYSNTFFVDVDDIFQTEGENLLYTDYFHPNDRGYEKMGNRIYEVMKDNVLADVLLEKSLDS